MVRFYDADAHQHEFGPITVEIPIQCGEGPGSHWEQVAKEEGAACAVLQEDMECARHFPPMSAE